MEKPVIQMEIWQHVVAVSAMLPFPEGVVRDCIWRKQEVSAAASLGPWDEQGSELYSVLHSICTLLNYIPPFQTAASEKGIEEPSHHLVSPQPPVHMQLRGEMEQNCSNSQASWCTGVAPLCLSQT